jgi:hypothetical protein
MTLPVARAGLTAWVVHYLYLLGLSKRIVRCWARRFPSGTIVGIPFGVVRRRRWRVNYSLVTAYWLGIHELAVQEALASWLEPGQVFYDIGANAGFFTLLGAQWVGVGVHRDLAGHDSDQRSGKHAHGSSDGG